ncbi:FAD-dependent oxidoreductase [Paraferrimonas sedimenticola]|uniref:NADH oxidase n=1 Tax=Paraferrimonas sedimenticola TaxID=375674 RepID=A0AA37RXB3_9GAMM|nr:FAD-dependent oxidoreductase [Paraferrimonas sedimenticola]GLP97053.1 NADH oxidase [Paraferrimonas sedimenticola]
MSSTNNKIVIIGGVAGGASAAARARRLSEDAEIVMFERGPFVSFANCGLPYHVGGEIEQRSKLILQTPQSFNNRFNVDVRVQHEVIAIHRSDKQVRVKDLATGKEFLESYDALVYSPGAAPIVPPIAGIDNPLTFTLRNIPDMDRIIEQIDSRELKQVAVIGGGFIGLEMMEAFVHRGIKTTLVEALPQVMNSVDREMAGIVHQEIRSKGVDLKLNTKLTQISHNPAQQTLTLSLNDNESLDVDLLIMAIGVRPEVGLARDAGLEIGEFGGVLVNSQMQTNDPVIYAVGDAVQTKDLITGEQTLVPLAGPANRQGRIAADNILGHEAHYQATQATAICKVFDFAVGSTGKNEKQLKQLEIDYEKVFVHAASHAGYYPGAEIVSLKVLFEKSSGKLLGAQAVAKDGVDKRIDVLAVAIRAGMTIDELEHLELSYAPPYGSAKDLVNLAGFVGTNIIKGLVAPVHFDQMDAPADNQLILDVRTPNELKNTGCIEGAINIPVDELRQRASELPKDKEILVYCQVGLRGHVAYRMLTNLGYQAKNLIGGYRSYRLAKA